MTAPDPSPWPHLAPEPSDAEPDEFRTEVRYPAPAYPHDDGSPLAIWEQQATEHWAAQREQAAARRLRSLAAQAEAWKNAEHQAYLADCERAVQRARAEAELAALRVPRTYDPREIAEPAPASPGRARHAVPERPEDPRDPEPDDDEDQGDDAGAASLEKAAADLFKIAPDVSRDALQSILRVNTYWAKKLHANRPRAER